MSHKFSKFKKGFSMIELLIVITIAVIMTGVLFVSRNSSKAENAVEAASRQVAAQIRALQNEALTGKPIDIGGGTIKNANEYHFDANINATASSITYEDSASDPIAAGAQSPNLPKGVKFGSTVNFYFKSPRGEVNPAGNKAVILTDTGGAVLRYICISNTGNVTEQKTVCP